MIKARIKLSDKANYILNTVKDKHNLKNKSEAVSFVVNWYKENILNKSIFINNII